ncbi:unnamed protein product [Tenebrio molitor]|nr:unnamed protein product [Tenebrio molitor]
MLKNNYEDLVTRGCSNPIKETSELTRVYFGSENNKRAPGF